MIIKDIFEKDIEREIDGVIKANDFKQIDLEVDEYVITKEIEDKLDTFFDLYASTIGNPTKDIGMLNPTYELAIADVRTKPKHSYREADCIFPVSSGNRESKISK